MERKKWRDICRQATYLSKTKYEGVFSHLKKSTNNLCVLLLLNNATMNIALLPSFRSHVWDGTCWLSLPHLSLFLTLGGWGGDEA
jgi:hypothetical protein